MCLHYKTLSYITQTKSTAFHLGQLNGPFKRQSVLCTRTIVKTVTKNKLFFHRCHGLDFKGRKWRRVLLKLNKTFHNACADELRQTDLTLKPLPTSQHTLCVLAPSQTPAQSHFFIPQSYWKGSKTPTAISWRHATPFRFGPYNTEVWCHRHCQMSPAVDTCHAR